MRRQPSSVGSTTAALLWFVFAVPGHANDDPDLEWHLDFEKITTRGVAQPGDIWDVRDESPNGFDTEFVLDTFNGLMNLSVVDVPLEVGVVGHALKCTSLARSKGLTGWQGIYERGDGLTILTWARIDVHGSLEAFALNRKGANGPDSDVILARIGRSREGDISCTWKAWQEDAFKGWAWFLEASPRDTEDWFHFAAVYDPDSNQAAMYFNGAELARQDVVGEPEADWGGPVQGAVYAQLWAPWNADQLGGYQGEAVVVDDVKLYTHALSPDEIRTVAESGQLRVSAREQLATTWGLLKRG